VLQYSGAVFRFIKRILIAIYMRFDILTIFPEAFESYLNTSMLKRARDKKIADIRVHDLRKFASDKHKKVDDRSYGGGPGMVLKIEPIVKAIESIFKTNHKSQIPNRASPTGFSPNLKQIPISKIQRSKTKIILFSATGKQFDARMAADFAKKFDRIIMIAGHYEGIDERVKKVIENLKFKIENLSVGPYVLTGGELPAMAVVDAVSRHIPGFLGKGESLEEKRFGVGVPVYTRPEIFQLHKKVYSVPRVLLSGDHKKIAAWRESHIKRTSSRGNGKKGR